MTNLVVYSPTASDGAAVVDSIASDNQIDCWGELNEGSKVLLLLERGGIGYIVAQEAEEARRNLRKLLYKLQADVTPSQFELTGVILVPAHAVRNPGMSICHTPAASAA